MLRKFSPSDKTLKRHCADAIITRLDEADIDDVVS